MKNILRISLIIFIALVFNFNNVLIPECYAQNNSMRQKISEARAQAKKKDKKEEKKKKKKEPPTVPEPNSILLFFAGLLIITLLIKKRQIREK